MVWLASLRLVQMERQREAWLVKPPTREEQHEQNSRIGERNQIWEREQKIVLEGGQQRVIVQRNHHFLQR